MSRRGTEFQSHGDILQQFPELQRARDLFTDLFKDRSPLVSLSYTPRQIEWTTPVLRLIEGSGEIETHISPPYLSFENPRDPDVETVQIYQLPDLNGYHLHAIHDPMLRRREGETREQRFWNFFRTNPNRMFEIYEGMVAHIILFKETANVENLEYLVKTVMALEHFAVQVKKESIFSIFGRKLGLVGTFEATWLDNARTEIVIKAEVPNELTEPFYYQWKRLKPVYDSYGTVIPVGQKPNISHNKIDKILSEEREFVLAGQLARQRA